MIIEHWQLISLLFLSAIDGIIIDRFIFRYHTGQG